MAELCPDLGVVIRVTSPEWGRRAGALAQMIADAGCTPGSIQIESYPAVGDRANRVSSGYDRLARVRRRYVLSIDADSYVLGNLDILVQDFFTRGAGIALRPSPLQVTARDGWQQERYVALFRSAKLPYRPLGTTCAFLTTQHLAAQLAHDVAECRGFVDEQVPKGLSRNYHHAQAAFALALASHRIGDAQTWWWDHEQLSWPGEPHGIIHHGALAQYKAPYTRKEGVPHG